MRHTGSIALAVAQLVLAANAQVELDMDDVPNPCKTICRPIGTLSERCDVDLRSDNDRDEHHLQNQCICTNKSFDVGKVAALCADCMHQSRKNRRDDDDNHADHDDLQHIDEILSVCGFSSTTYNAAATSEVANINVAVTRPTDVSQLTTTIDRSHPAGGAGGGSSATATSSGQSGQSTSGASTATILTSPSTTAASQTSSSAGSSSSSSAASSSSASSSSSTPNAAPAATAQAVYAIGGMVAAAYLMV